MNDNDWKCSDDQVLELLRADESGTSEDAKGRVFRRLAASLGAPSGTSDPADPPSPSPHGAATAAPLAAASGRPWTLALAFMLGGGVGAAVHATLAQPPAPRIVYIERPTITEVASDERAPAIAPSASASTALESTDAPPTRRSDGDGPRAPGAAKSSTLADLAAQQSLLDAARASFGRGENEAALHTIVVHERRYPDSVLTEEREALAIKALVASKSYAQAKARGSRFAERYPRSLLLPAVSDALASIP